VRWHRGHLCHVSGSPDVAQADVHLVEEPDGALLVDDDGQIAWSGAWSGRPSSGHASGDVPVVDHAGAFLLPGFVDTHMHFPQVYRVDAYGGGSLLDWLDRVVFPCESLLADPAMAKRAAADFCRRLAGAGTTTSLVFGSQFPVAQEALADEVARRGLRMITGRTIMTTGPRAAEPLLTDEATALALAREEIERWLPAIALSSPFAGIALVPRFALSVEPSTLVRLGDLYAEFQDRGLYVTTHLNENCPEILEVQRRYGVRRYLDVYDGRVVPGGGASPSLLGRRTVLAHAVHCEDEELARIAASGA
jgi:guanine deaminase